MSNSSKKPEDWAADIEQSVSQYNSWFIEQAPLFWSESRARAGAAIGSLMADTSDLRELTAESLVEPSDLLAVLRAATLPPIAKERLATLSNVRTSLVNRLHQGKGLAKRWDQDEVTRLVDQILQMLDPVVFPWVREERSPTTREREGALLVVGDRTAATFYNPLFRNAQEKRQLVLLRKYLTSLGYEPTTGSGIEMPDRTFTVHRDVPYENENGVSVGLPIDCAVSPGEGRPVALIELKSAGDFTNVNKRRKEEASKATGVRRKHGEKVVFLLQLFGYFDRGYCSYEASHNIDWAWDHRLSDLDDYLA